MTNAKRLYESWMKIRKDPKYLCEHKKLEEQLTTVIEIVDNICKPCDGYDVICKHYSRSEG